MATFLVARHRLAARFKLFLENNVGRRQLQRQQRRSLSAGNDGSGKQRLRRSVHFVPADNDKFLSKCLSLGADTVVLDLEDSVRDKDAGRETLRSFLGRADSAPGRDGTEVLVRINPLSVTGEFGREIWREDVEAGFDGADGFMVPKVESSDELRLLDEVLTDLERRNGAGGRKVLLPIATETPLAVANVADIARGPRVCGITWGCEDLSAELGSFGTRRPDGEYLDVFRYCRAACLLAARATGVQAIDGIFQDVRDLDGFEKEARDAVFAGFDGKLTLHPGQVAAAHRAFAPTRKELEEASAIASMWEEGDEGRGSLEYKGRMIDLPHYVRAKKVIARGSGAGDSVRSEDDVRSDDDKPKVATTSTGTAGETKPQTSAPSEDDAGEDVFPRVHLGKYFEDLTPGLKIRHFLTRTVTEADNVFFTCLTLNPAPIHLDHELSRENSSALGGKSSGGGKPLFNSMFTLALLVGMSVPESTHGTTVANLGFSEVLFPRPVYPGDTLRAETEVVERRESKSRPTQGIVTLRHVAYNQRGEVVCRATRQALMRKRP